MTASLTTAFLVGLLGGIHCLGMCGGIVTSLTLSQPRLQTPLERLPTQLGYNLGRLLGYGVIGALFGGLGDWMLSYLPLEDAQRLLYAAAAVMMLLLGLYLGRWWQGLATLERLGGRLWRYIEPIGRRWLPIRHAWQAVAVGFVWAWLPCGLVYSVLIWSLATGSAGAGALLMLAFGLGTLPNLLGMGLLAGAAARLLERPWLSQIAGAIVIGFALMAFWQLFAA
jgi:sulfite exporter TauE/SafE